MENALPKHVADQLFSSRIRFWWFLSILSLQILRAKRCIEIPTQIEWHTASRKWLVKKSTHSFLHCMNMELALADTLVINCLFLIVQMMWLHGLLDSRHHLDSWNATQNGNFRQKGESSARAASHGSIWMMGPKTNLHYCHKIPDINAKKKHIPGPRISITFQSIEEFINPALLLSKIEAQRKKIAKMATNDGSSSEEEDEETPKLEPITETKQESGASIVERAKSRRSKELKLEHTVPQF